MAFEGPEWVSSGASILERWIRSSGRRRDRLQFETPNPGRREAGTRRPRWLGDTQLDRRLVISAKAYARLIDSNDTGHARPDHFQPCTLDEAKVSQSFRSAVAGGDPLNHRHVTGPQSRNVQSNHSLANPVEGPFPLEPYYSSTKERIMRLRLKINSNSKNSLGRRHEALDLTSTQKTAIRLQKVRL